ncbi:hypothetical protein FRX31_005277 [Thalictrum thalictroides]|uniref:C2H2-type domain-containing protein n=1 Tax=Thalictrum thalictroides TaxID=46969 RepID=A0A7J6X5P7_THATH|nr:hypothetical protein FRX31_005277 [Thalictrum thalictroides]
MSSKKSQVLCLHCNTLVAENKLKEHSKAVHHIDTFKCSKCKNYLGSSRALDIHQTSKHPVKPQRKGKKQNGTKEAKEPQKKGTKQNGTKEAKERT